MQAALAQQVIDTIRPIQRLRLHLHRRRLPRPRPRRRLRLQIKKTRFNH